MQRRQLLLAAVALLAFARPVGAEPVLNVVASISILGDMVRSVGGERVKVRTLVGADGDAHGFEPSPADARAVAGADLVVANGLDLEAWLDRLVAAAGYKGPVVTTSEGVAARRMEHDGHAELDPHAWQDLRNGVLYTRNIAAGLARVDPAGRAEYERNAEAYIAGLERLDAKLRAEIAKVPPPRRKVVTSHDAFSYFGDAYGVEFLAPQGMSEDAEPSARDLRLLIDQIRREGIKVVFLENALAPGLVRQIADETGARIGGTLYADALSGPGGPAETYPKMVEHNATLLISAMLAAGQS
jgi:zinc/manganese transport system substrate-binding protein